MNCQKHPEVEMREVCGEMGCGLCYADQMAQERVRPAQNHPGHGFVDGYNDGYYPVVWAYSRDEWEAGRAAHPEKNPPR